MVFGIALLAQQQFRDQIGAKKEKDADAKFPGTRDGSELGGFVELRHQAMRKEHEQKGKSAKNIEARAVESIYSRLNPFHLDDDGGGCRHRCT